MPESKHREGTFAFISDWKQRAGAQRRKQRVYLAAALVIAFVISISLFVWYRHENYNRIVQLNIRYVEDCALQEANKVQRELDDAIKLVKKYARQYSVLVEDYPTITIEERLRLLCDGTLFDRIAFIMPDGTDISLEGTCNVADRAYFQRVLEGDYGYDLIDKSRITKRPALVFYTPVYQEQEIIGVMLGFYERERMDELLSYQFLNFEPQTYLLRGNGEVVGSSVDDNQSVNMLDELSKQHYLNDIDFDEIQAVINNPERTMVSFSFEENSSTSIGVIIQFNGIDWMLLSMLPSSVTETMVGNANDVSKTLLLTLAITSILLIGLLILFLVRQDERLDSEMSLATSSLQKTKQHDRRQTMIVESLGNTYSSVYLVDIATLQYERIKELEPTALSIPDTGEWHAGFGGYLKHFVQDSYHEKMLPFRNLEDHAITIGSTELVGIEYQRRDEGWRKAFLIPAERDEENNVTSVIFAVQQIEAEKKRELETQKALQEAYEAAQLASTAKTTFLSNMSHDIRTPMNAIVGMTAIAGANLENKEKVSDCLKKITASSKHLLGLINEVLDMSKIESGKVDLNEEQFSLSELIDTLISMNQSLVREKNHALIVRVNQLTHEKVIGDSTRLQQVFNNLLTNAIKYTPQNGKIEITVTEKKTNKQNIGWYEVTFSDNGIGMSEAFQKTIFDPFSRADDDRISTIQGTGLGMAIARNIIRMMNGDITVESEINRGSTFTVSFSLRLQTDADTQEVHFVDLPVLVVDDDVEACECTCAMLDSLSMRSEWVTSGEAAIAKTVSRHQQQDDYYAVIVDWKMPKMNGIETAREIRRQIGYEVPIIVISAYDWSDIEEDARAAGVNGFLSKPLFKSKLIDLFSGLVESESHIPEAPQLRQDYHGKRVLLAEDNELNREIAVELLSMTGMEIETAENGKECLEMFMASQAGYYDLILMDIRMPVMNGYESTTAIRASSHPDAKTIPVVAMTANAFSTDVREAFDAGMNDHISKPIELDKVLQTISKFI